MHTYICETENLSCRNCGGRIAVDDEFAVVTSGSRPYENTCIPCAETRMAENIVNKKDGKATPCRIDETCSDTCTCYV